MNEDRAVLISWLRGEMVGPSRPVGEVVIVSFNDKVLKDYEKYRFHQLAWHSLPDKDPQEILHRNSDAPFQKYGAGLLHPGWVALDAVSSDNQNEDTIPEEVGLVPEWNEDGLSENRAIEERDELDEDDFEVSSPEARCPSTMGLTFCARMSADSSLLVRLPRKKLFFWQSPNDDPYLVNGRYERCIGTFDGKEHSLWRRLHCFLPDTELIIRAEDLRHRKTITKEIGLPDGSPMDLKLKIYPREIRDHDWLFTVVLLNEHQAVGGQQHQEATLYQAFFEVAVLGGDLVPYPESRREFSELDEDEQSLSLLYRGSATWAIGHGCAAGWDEASNLGQVPSSIYADVFPAVELPSMTPDIVDAEGNRMELSMRRLSALASDTQVTFRMLHGLAEAYANWIERQRLSVNELGKADLQLVANRHLDQCVACLNRIRNGIAILENDNNARNAFRLTNLAMLLQQIATKQLKRRPLCFDKESRRVIPEGEMQSPWEIYQSQGEGAHVGHWRAFQLAFFLMSINGVTNGNSADREIVDLIWFPTGGGKTEAYLAVAAFYMFYERLRMNEDQAGDLLRDGTNVLMRYTLRMLTTQQFQRAASLISAMEFLRRHGGGDDLPVIPGERFSLGLWVGRDATPNTINRAVEKLGEYRNHGNGESGNPFVLTECPWCRAEIGRYNGSLSRGVGNEARVRGIDANSRTEGPRLLCSDHDCEFGKFDADTWLPVEVIDERIYIKNPSIVIGTVDKFAMLAFRPAAGAIFGRCRDNGVVTQTHRPPGLIIQDELHLISGPLGTMYAMYETVFERLCLSEDDGEQIRPKIISSTATIRGARDQVNALYARHKLSLFPSPGLTMGDSFFGTYARDEEGRLKGGRLYLGIHAHEFNFLSTQRNVFAAALFRSYYLKPDRRDPWWTLLVFFNSIRELGGAHTLFDSDIRDRLKFLFNREGAEQNRRYINNLVELTGRIDNAAIVSMMDKLSISYKEGAGNVVDACLASNIIEVGVDIDRLSLMAVVGQPKTTAQYIQVTGRVGRKWESRPGLVLMLYNPSKSRDRSHYEHFHSYHKRLYEQVEPTSATPFSGSAIVRALPGILISWVRQIVDVDAPGDFERFRAAFDQAYGFVEERCGTFLFGDEKERAMLMLKIQRDELLKRWQDNPQDWERWPQKTDGQYLMLWPGEYSTRAQKARGVDVASSMRNVDVTAGLAFTSDYVIEERNR